MAARAKKFPTAGSIALGVLVHNAQESLVNLLADCDYGEMAEAFRLVADLADLCADLEELEAPVGSGAS